MLGNRKGNWNRAAAVCKKHYGLSHFLRKGRAFTADPQIPVASGVLTVAVIKLLEPEKRAASVFCTPSISTRSLVTKEGRYCTLRCLESNRRAMGLEPNFTSLVATRLR